MTLILLGQPELAKVVNANKPFEQRIGVKMRLDPLNIVDMQAYIVHRLRVGGHQVPERVFSPEALALIYESTGGLPRRINRLCDICLLSGFAAQARAIGPELVGEEVKALEG